MTLREKAIEAGAREFMRSLMKNDRVDEGELDHFMSGTEGDITRAAMTAAFDAILSIIAEPDEAMLCAASFPVSPLRQDCDQFLLAQDLTEIYQAMIRKLQEV